MEFNDTVCARRMVRSFTGRPVDGQVLDRLLAAARRSPTAGNTEGWALVVLRGADETGPFWEATTDVAWQQRSRRWPGLTKAPVVVAVFTSPDRYRDRYAEPDKAASGLAGDPWPVPYWFVDVGQVVATLLLAAVDAGLGGCFLGNFRGEEELRAALGVPPGWRYAGAVLLGEPAHDDPRSPSLDRSWRHSDSSVHRGRW